MTECYICRIPIDHPHTVLGIVLPIWDEEGDKTIEWLCQPCTDEEAASDYPVLEEGGWVAGCRKMCCYIRRREAGQSYEELKEVFYLE